MVTHTSVSCVQHQNFEESQEAMKQQLLQLSILLKALDPELCDFLGESAHVLQLKLQKTTLNQPPNEPRGCAASPAERRHETRGRSALFIRIYEFLYKSRGKRVNI